MALWLQIILALVLVVVGGSMVVLLLQLRRTAASIGQLADCARQDIHQIADDIHRISVQADALAEKANAVMELPMVIGRMATGTLQNLEAATERGLPTWLAMLLTGLKFAINLWRRKPDPARS
jgi:hypothetical protein